MRVNLVLRTQHVADLINFFDSFDIDADVAHDALNDLVTQLKSIKKVHDLHKDTMRMIRRVDTAVKRAE